MEDGLPSGVEVLDGYRLIRFLGRGGFGEVWLCRSEAMGDYRALKWIPAGLADRMQKEYDSLLLYCNAAAKLRSPNLVPIEHINRVAAGLYYVMPLADGMTDVEPTDPAWRPMSLAAVLQKRSTLPKWFSADGVCTVLHPILEALQTLSDAGLVHRDVKPDNILFFHGAPSLGDISLLGEDASLITRRGTPGYATPSWYVGGHPDMYGAAATLYALLTGNPPDMMGRAAFLWPPQGEASLSEAERFEWKRLHGVIRRATEERVSERFVDFRAMADALSAVGPVAGQSKNPPRLPAFRRKSPAVWIATGVLGLLVAAWVTSYISRHSDKVAESPAELHSKQSQSQLHEDQAPAVNRPEQAAAAYEDAQVAYNSLTWVQNDYLGMTSNQNNLYQNAMVAMSSCVTSKETFDPKQAVRKLDQCLSGVGELRGIPNVLLARLLFLQCAGDTATVKKEIENPIFATPGSDNLGYRVELLCRLNAADKAETLLDKTLAGNPKSPNKKSEMLIERAEVKARLGKFAESQRDANAALAVAGADAAFKADVEMKLEQVEQKYPNYAAYLKARREK